MKIFNFSGVSPKPKWEKTDEGWLRCKARVLKEMVMPYHWKEIHLEGVLLPDIINVAVKLDEMARPEALRSIEGVPLLAGDHVWLDGDNIRNLSVGSVAGSPIINGKYLECDLLVTEPDAIRRIEAGELPEISAGYQAVIEFEPGKLDGTNYQALQSNLKFNHIAIIPAGAGRAGEDVKILNKRGEQQMTPYEKGRAKAEAEIEAMRKRVRGESEEYEEAAADLDIELMNTRRRSSLDRLGFSDPNTAAQAALQQVINCRRKSSPFGPTASDIRHMMNATQKASRETSRAIVMNRLSNEVRIGLTTPGEAAKQLQEYM
jgi:hypothetical protein